MSMGDKDWLLQNLDQKKVFLNERVMLKVVYKLDDCKRGFKEFCSNMLMVFKLSM